MIKYPSIGQFRNVIRHVQQQTRFVGKDADGNAIYDQSKSLPTLGFYGTVKLHGCVHRDTLVTLADGSKEKIKDICEGTSILSYNETTNTVEFDTVNEVVIQELEKPWIELFFDNGTSLKCTADHPILTTEGWVDAADLEDTHILITEM